MNINMVRFISGGHFSIYTLPMAQIPGGTVHCLITYIVYVIDIWYEKAGGMPYQSTAPLYVVGMVILSIYRRHLVFI